MSLRDAGIAGGCQRVSLSNSFDDDDGGDDADDADDDGDRASL